MPEVTFEQKREPSGLKTFTLWRSIASGDIYMLLKRSNGQWDLLGLLGKWYTGGVCESDMMRILAKSYVPAPGTVTITDDGDRADEIAAT